MAIALAQSCSSPAARLNSAMAIGAEDLGVDAQHLGHRPAVAGEPEVHLAVGQEGVLQHEVGAQPGGVEPGGVLLMVVVEVAEHPDFPAGHPHVLVGGPRPAVAFQAGVVAAALAVERMFFPPRHDVVKKRLCGTARGVVRAAAMGLRLAARSRTGSHRLRLGTEHAELSQNTRPHLPPQAPAPTAAGGVGLAIGGNSSTTPLP